LIVYDITNRDSINCSEWSKGVEEHAAPGVPIIIVGMKKDKEAERVVSVQEGQELAKNFHGAFFEASSKTGEGVNRVFDSLACVIMDTHIFGTPVDWSSEKLALMLNFPRVLPSANEFLIRSGIEKTSNQSDTKVKEKPFCKTS